MLVVDCEVNSKRKILRLLFTSQSTFSFSEDSYPKQEREFRFRCSYQSKNFIVIA